MSYTVRPMGPLWGVFDIDDVEGEDPLDVRECFEHADRIRRELEAKEATIEDRPALREAASQA